LSFFSNNLRQREREEGRERERGRAGEREGERERVDYLRSLMSFNYAVITS